MGLLCFVALHAEQAGREGESGTGALWIAPELVAGASPALPCGQAASLARRDLVFETLDPADLDTELPRLLAAGTREVVDFTWNPATSELSFTTTAPTAVFSDLALPGQASGANSRNCGSR